MIIDHCLDFTAIAAVTMKFNEFPATVNPLLSPPGGLFFQVLLRGGLIEREGLKEREGLFNLAKRITCSKNTVVTDRVDLRFVQVNSLSKVFNSLVGA